MKNIPVYCNDEIVAHAKVDDADFKWLNRHSWYFCKGYAYRKERGVSKYMHREILGSRGKTRTDHINGDKLDNRRKNLRKCTASQNAINTGKYARAAESRYKGVSLHKKSGRWKARLFFRGKEIHIGYFSSEFKAAKAYNSEAKKRFGKFARMNVK